MNSNKQMKRTKSINLQTEAANSFWKKVFYSQEFIAVIALTFLILILFPLAKSYSRRLVADKEISEMRDKIIEVEKVNKELAELIEYSQSLQAAEEHARMSSNLKNNGEGVIIIQKNLENDAATEEDVELENSNHFKLWWSYFFK